MAKDEIRFEVAIEKLDYVQKTLLRMSSRTQLPSVDHWNEAFKSKTNFQIQQMTVVYLSLANSYLVSDLLCRIFHEFSPRKLCC